MDSLFSSYAKTDAVFGYIMYHALYNMRNEDAIDVPFEVIEPKQEEQKQLAYEGEEQ